MSEPRKPPVPARPAAPNAPKPAPPGATGSPRPPQVGGGPIRGKMPSSPGYTPPKKDKELPSDSGWETADTVTSIPDGPTPNIPPAAPTPKGGIVAPVSSAPMPPPAPSPAPTPQPTPQPATPRSVPPPASTSPAASLQGLSAPMREEVWAIVRAAIAEATQPMIAKQRELEERVARAEQAAANAKSNSIPVLIGPSLAPPANVPPAPAKPRLSIPPGVYGVAVVDPGPQKPAVDLANVGPIHDMPDFGGRSKLVARVIAGIMILAVVAAIVATIASRS